MSDDLGIGERQDYGSGLENIRLGEIQTLAPPPPPRPADYTPWQEQLPSARVPHLGHALLFLLIAGISLFLAQAVAFLPLPSGHMTASSLALHHPKLLVASEAASYLLTLLTAWLIFPLLWHRSFLSGIQWNGAAARRVAMKLVPIGLATGWAVQGISSLISMPKQIPMDNFFRSTSDVWLVTIFGTLLAPLFEEITFRGFLLPAFTIAFDWLGPMLRYAVQFSLCRVRGEEPPRHVFPFREDRSAGLAEDTGNLAFRSRTAIIAASLVTSGLFGLMHAAQLGYTWAAVLLLSGVALVLTAVRIKLRSVACSTIVHASYNLSIFLLLFVATGGYRHLDHMTR